MEDLWSGDGEAPFGLDSSCPSLKRTLKCMSGKQEPEGLAHHTPHFPEFMNHIFSPTAMMLSSPILCF